MMMMSKLFVVSLALLLCAVSARANGQFTKNVIASLPGYSGALSSAQYSGYVEVNSTIGGNLFYWFFESQSNPSTDPLVMWLSGGPGCSSAMSALNEHIGPYNVNDDGTELSPNEFSWNRNANVVFLDQPLGTGFSYMDKPLGHYVHSEEEMANYVYIFLQQFLGNDALFSSFASREFFIFAESYGGHWAPSVAKRVNAGNDAATPGTVRINLRGIAMGNGMTSTVEQYAAYAPFALGRGLIDGNVFQQAQSMYPACEAAVASGKYSTESAACNSILELVLQHAGPINTYDVTDTCDPGLPLCYNFTGVTNYLNRVDVQSALGVDRPWELCSPRVHLALTTDWFSSQAFVVPDMLKRNQTVTAYAGIDGFIVNFLGVANWMRQVPWPGQADYQKGKRAVWMIDGDIAGYVLNSASFGGSQGLLQQIDVHNAGHMVPFDQPRAAQAMFENIVNGVRSWT
jgi:carboxypeptidase C (cathepsin A)